VKLHSYDFAPEYKTSVAYFSMEYAIHQALKNYAGGLGFLAGSHMRSAYELRQNTVGVGILWSYGYYDQNRHPDRRMEIEFVRKNYYFLQPIDVNVSVAIDGNEVFVRAYLLPDTVFSSAPLILLSTDIPENDYLARTITHHLYDSNEQTRIAQEIVLGIGGVRILEALKHSVDIYHMNEPHVLPLVFELYDRYHSIKKLKKHVVFTTHAADRVKPEGHDIDLLHKFGFFARMGLDDIRENVIAEGNRINLMSNALRFSKITNAISRQHGTLTNTKWQTMKELPELTYITNAQNRRFWADKGLVEALDQHEDYQLVARKKHNKHLLFDIVADQTGKMLDPEVLTIVWARRFVEHKRPGLLKYDMERFTRLLQNSEKPVQVIWAGKPHPFDTQAVNMFNELIHISHRFKRMAVLVGYELDMSHHLKKGADVWLNTPRASFEASGTSGISASMNGALHLSFDEGWHPEFARHGINAFTVPSSSRELDYDEQDRADSSRLIDMLENEVIPTYYSEPRKWLQMMKAAMTDVMPTFQSGRMAHEYYTKMYDA
jgi:starch phosphorylase